MFSTPGLRTYTYWPSNNQLRTASAPYAVLSYDALDRLATIDSSTDSRFAYDGLDLIGEYDGLSALRNRYVFVPGIDEPLVSYSSAGTRTWLTADERGSIVAHSNDNGAVTLINRYDEYGVPASTNGGRFQYTGQMWLPEAAVYHYKFRAYDPSLGSFLQVDPIGYAGGMNLYAYVGKDPVNYVDPLGLLCVQADGTPCGTIIVPGERLECSYGAICGSADDLPHGSFIPGPLTFAPPGAEGGATAEQTSEEDGKKSEVCAGLRAAASEARNGNPVYLSSIGGAFAYYFGKHSIHAIHLLRSGAILGFGAARGGTAGAGAGSAGGPLGAAAGALVGIVIGGAIVYSEATRNTTIGADAIDSLANALGCKKS